MASSRPALFDSTVQRSYIADTGPKNPNQVFHWADGTVGTRADQPPPTAAPGNPWQETGSGLSSDQD